MKQHKTTKNNYNLVLGYKELNLCKIQVEYKYL